MNIILKPVLLWSMAVSIMLTASSAQTIPLFNGKDLQGWHIDVPEMDTNKTARNPFIIRNGLLVSLGEPNGH